MCTFTSSTDDELNELGRALGKPAQVPPVTAASIAGSAASMVSGDRAIYHGDLVVTHQKIADMWNAILLTANKATAQPLDGHDVANLMEGLKIARRYCGSYNPDDYVDGAGYSAVAGAIRARDEDAS